MDFPYMLEILPEVASYIPTTLVLAFVSMFFAVVIGLIVAFGRRSKNKIISSISATYISVFRGVPTVVQLFIIYFGLPQLFPSMSNLSAMSAAIIGLSFKEASYLAEIFRAALDSVDSGQIEAGLSVGMKSWKIYQTVVIPQAVVNAVPGTLNVFISLVKESSIVFTLGATEVFASAKLIASSSMLYFETYVVVGFICWVIIVVISWLQGKLERKIAVPYKRS
ncbi:amino acid ABC transporter permease [Aerococcus urinaeequi]|uniref:Amino acid ABC transporter permease n=1 Tax=Aerococcus urinaeequi TaxID=51665 RepID=A0AA47GB81_9LACT|nr:amino acid ABC transporter permease [Aerococcus urinaeequi]MDT2762522.1 amino acid ABC transporter permease [Aerococcus urinaeequi]WAT25416.1 amino acid ABC transporter permease [Aerococcus urinaeequi]